ncbi:MAG: hypothetical protein R3A43_03035 [Bacteroidia bacterium]
MKKVSQLVLITLFAVAMAFAVTSCNNGGEKKECDKENCEDSACCKKDGAEKKECCKDKEEKHVCGDECKDGCKHAEGEKHECTEACGENCPHKAEMNNTEGDSGNKEAHVCTDECAKNGCTAHKG